MADSEEEQKKKVIWITEEDIGKTKISIDPKEETIIILTHPDLEFSE